MPDEPWCLPFKANRIPRFRALRDPGFRGHAAAPVLLPPVFPEFVARANDAKARDGEQGQARKPQPAAQRRDRVSTWAKPSPLQPAQSAGLGSHAQAMERPEPESSHPRQGKERQERRGAAQRGRQASAQPPKEPARSAHTKRSAQRQGASPERAQAARSRARRAIRRIEPNEASGVERHSAWASGARRRQAAPGTRKAWTASRRSPAFDP